MRRGVLLLVAVTVALAVPSVVARQCAQQHVSPGRVPVLDEAPEALASSIYFAGCAECGR